MKKSLLEIYSLSVCRVIVVATVIVLSISGYEMIRIVNPKFTLSPHHSQLHEINQLILKNWPSDRPVPDEVEKLLSGEKKYDDELLNEQKRGLQHLVRASLFLAGGVVVFLVHWRIAKRQRLKAAS